MIFINFKELLQLIRVISCIASGVKWIEATWNGYKDEISTLGMRGSLPSLVPKAKHKKIWVGVSQMDKIRLLLWDGSSL